MSADPLDLRETILSRLVKKRRERMFMEPASHLWNGRDGRHLGRRGRGREIAKETRFLELWTAIFTDLHREKTLVYDLPEPIHDARPVEIDARRPLVL